MWYLYFGSHYLLTLHVLRTVRACIVSVLVLWLSFFFLFRSESDYHECPLLSIEYCVTHNS